MQYIPMDNVQVTILSIAVGVICLMMIFQCKTIRGLSDSSCGLASIIWENRHPMMSIGLQEAVTSVYAIWQVYQKIVTIFTGLF